MFCCNFDTSNNNNCELDINYGSTAGAQQYSSPMYCLRCPTIVVAVPQAIWQAKSSHGGVQ